MDICQLIHIFYCACPGGELVSIDEGTQEISVRLPNKHELLAIRDDLSCYTKLADGASKHGPEERSIRARLLRAQADMLDREDNA